MKTLTILGCRPQFIKAAPVLKLMQDNILVHTGQHYSKYMSDIFFSDLSIKEPDYNLDVGSGSHNFQITTMMQKLEPIIEKEKPECIIVYGDTNSTLAGAIIAKEYNIRLIHVEAGLRSYNMHMPEEINRILTDKISDVKLCPTENALKNLINEGLGNNTHLVGDTMYDLIIENKFFYNRNKLDSYGVKEKDFYLCTLHRPQNVDDIEKLNIIFNAFGELDKIILFPCHPRTKNTINEFEITLKDNIRLIDPVGYIDMMTLIAASDRVITDSGGVQKEAHILETPCVTLRNETEWIESVECGANRLTNINHDDILNNILNNFNIKHIHPYGDGEAAQAIIEVVYD